MIDNERGLETREEVVVGVEATPVVVKYQQSLEVVDVEDVKPMSIIMNRKFYQSGRVVFLVLMQ